ncbi:MAG: DUF1566 domain-containing protein [Spirochaetaceae bacterium]|nr:DUF1566 domain-containing protein [Spirochaetaceae bacterium]
MTNRERTSQFLSNKQQATSNKQQATSNKQQATSNKQQATSNKQQATNSIKRLFIALTAIILAFSLTSCGGGGGGGGTVSSWHKAESGGIHNSGDAGGWGTGTSTGTGFAPNDPTAEETEAGPLISQMAALDVTTVDIQLTVNNEPQPLIVADATTTTAVLPKIKPGYIVSGSATIHLADGSTRVAQLDATEAELHGVLKFKVPYNYTAYDLSNTQVSSGTYFSRDGIDLSSVTTENIAGWQCINDGTTHNGSYVTGVRGDIELYAVPAEGANVLTAVPDKTSLIAGSSTASDYTATITITNAASTPLVTATGYLVNDPPVQDASDPTKYTASVYITGSGNPAMFADNTSATVDVVVGTETRQVTFTLKNKYKVEVEYTSPTGNVDAAEIGTFLQGSSLAFSTVSASASSMLPAGREAVAFEHGSSMVLYKNASTGATSVTINSTNFSSLTSRTIILKPVLDFTCSLSDGGYGTTASPLSSQNGTSTNPYLLNYYGNDTNKCNQIELEISDNKCADSALTIGSTQTAIVSATFDITHTGNKFLIKIKPTLAADSVYTSNTIKLTITDPTSGAKKDVHVLLKMVRIGSKAAPDAVGDIVFNDGSAMSYTDFNNLDAATKNEKKAAAIALIFYKGSASDALGARILGVGLKHESGLEWCTSSADAYDKDIDTIQCIPSGSAGAYTFSGDKDGSDNLSQIAAFPGVNDTGTESNYRAFYFAKKYNEQKLGSESSSRIPAGSQFENGWYLPSIAELFQIYACREDSTNGFDIDTASNALGGDGFGNSVYWSSSQHAFGGDYAYRLNFTDGDCGYNCLKDGNLHVCAIRAF